MFFEPMNFIKNLKYMGTGMLSILIVIGVIVVFTAILNKVTTKKNENHQ
ncbi:MAG: oxaloacetate decarboxylase [Clostridia bacterium]|nr:oxaloacetate decarboxylase [Clostridia bacterium]